MKENLGSFEDEPSNYAVDGNARDTNRERASMSFIPI